MNLPLSLMRYLSLCIFMLGGYFVQGQTISKPIVTGTPVCGGSKITVTFTVTNGGGGTYGFTTSTEYRVYDRTGGSEVLTGTFTSNVAPVYAAYESAEIKLEVPIPSNASSYPTASDYQVRIESRYPTAYSASWSDQFTVNNTPTPTPTVSNNGPLCVGGTLQLTASAISGATYKWTGPNGFTATGRTPSLTNVTTAMAGTYTVTATVNGCASSPVSTNVTINSTPPSPTASNNGPICVGGTLQLNASSISGATYRWTGPNGYTSTAQNPTRSNATASMAGVYTVVATVNGCSSSPVSTTVGGAVATDSQTTAGTDSWIGHVYDGTGFNTYAGNYTETESFDRNFGGNTTCFGISANSVPLSIYTETFSVRYRMNSSRRGLFVVDLGSDDGSRLRVDGNLVYNNWVDQAYSVRPRVLMNLTGNSNLVYEFYENAGGNQVSFRNLTKVLENVLTGNIEQEVCSGGAAVQISGDVYGTLPGGISKGGTTGFQWAYGTTPNGTTTDIPGATGATYTPDVTTAPFNSGGTFYIFRKAILVSSNNTGVTSYTATNFSNAATLKVNQPVSNNTIQYKVAGTLCGTVNENGNLNLSAPEGTIFTSVDFASYGTPSGSCGNFTQSTCHSTSSQSIVESYILGKNSASIPATNTVFGDPCVSTVKRLYVQATYSRPTEDLCCGDQPLSILGSIPQGSGDLTYYWEHSTAGPGSGFSPAPGENTLQNYTPEPLQQTTWFRRSVFAGNCQPAASNIIEIPVNPLPTGTLSGPSSVCSGEAAVLTANFTGTAPWTVTGSYGAGSTTFQVQQSPFSVTDYPTQTTTYSITSVTDANGCTNNEVSSVTVTVPQAAGNNTITGNQSFCGAASPETLMGSEATGSPIKYLWEASITGSTSGFSAAPGVNNNKDYTPGPLTQTTWFRRVASNHCSSLTSNVVEVTVYQPVSGNTITLSNSSNVSQAVCTGLNPGTITGAVPTGGNSTYAYIWESSTTGPESGFDPATGTNNTVDYNPGELSQTTWFRRSVSSAMCEPSLSNVVEIIVNPLPALTTTSTDTTICIGETINITGSLSGTGPWTVRGTMNGAVFSIPTSSSSLSYAFSPTVTTTINITAVEDANGCVNNENHTVTITVLQENLWTGAEDTNWNNPANWNCSTVPTLETDVRIPSGLGNYPIILDGDSGLSRNLIIESGASVDIQQNLFGIAGQAVNQGVFNAEFGSVIFASEVSQTIPQGFFDKDLIENLYLSNAIDVTSEASINIKGLLHVIRGNFYTGNKLTLLSNSTGTAFIEGGGNGQVLDTVHMQRYLSNAFGYKYFSSPFQNSTVADLAANFDLTNPETGFPHLYEYLENREDSAGNDLTGWQKYLDSTASFKPGFGYAINPLGEAGTMTLELSGIVNNGPVSVALQNNNRTYTNGFNLVGNPYPSPIDWNLMVANMEGIDNGIHFFTATAGDRYTGTYTSYVDGVSTDGRSSNIIPSMQGFFVRVSDPVDGIHPLTATLQFNNSYRVGNETQQQYYKTKNKAEIPQIRLTAGFKGEKDADATVIYFSQGGTPQFEKELDAQKLLNTAVNVPSVYSLTALQEKLSINAVSGTSMETMEIPLGISAERSGEMSLSLAETTNLFPSVYIYLKDIKKNVLKDLDKDGDYTFTSQKGQINDRFVLMFSSEKLSPAQMELAMEDFTVYTKNEQVLVRLNLPNNAEGKVILSSMAGQVLQSKRGSGKDVLTFSGMAAGIYLVTLKTEQESQTKKVIFKE